MPVTHIGASIAPADADSEIRNTETVTLGLSQKSEIERVASELFRKGTFALGVSEAELLPGIKFVTRDHGFKINPAGQQVSFRDRRAVLGDEPQIEISKTGETRPGHARIFTREDLVAAFSVLKQLGVPETPKPEDVLKLIDETARNGHPFGLEGRSADWEKGRVFGWNRLRAILPRHEVA